MNKKSFSQLPTPILAGTMRAGLPFASNLTVIKSSSDSLHVSDPEPETLKEEVIQIIYKSIRLTNQLRT